MPEDRDLVERIELCGRNLDIWIAQYERELKSYESMLKEGTIKNKDRINFLRGRIDAYRHAKDLLYHQMPEIFQKEE